MGEDRTLIESGIQGSTPQSKLQHISSNFEGHGENYELGKASYSVSLRRTWRLLVVSLKRLSNAIWGAKQLFKSKVIFIGMNLQLDFLKIHWAI